MIVDCHVHIFPAFAGTPDHHGPVGLPYGRVLVGGSGGQVRQQLPPAFEVTRSTPEMALAHMDCVGVDRALLTQGHFYGFYDEYVASAVHQWPDRFWGMAVYNPTLGRRLPDHLERRMSEGGLLSIKCEVPSTLRTWPQFRLTDDSEMRVWERCASLGGLLMLHLPDGEAICADVMRIVESFPRLTVLCCHLGNAPADGWQSQVRMARHPRVYMDIAGVWFAYSQPVGDDPGEEYPYPRASELLTWAVHEVGADKLLWGTDYPSTLRHNTYLQYINFVRRQAQDLTPAERALILGDTAAKLFRSVANQ